MPQPRKTRAATVPARLLDTNVILRFLIGDDPPKAARASALMDRVERSEVMVEVPEAVLTETVWTLESFYKVPRNEIAQKLGALVCLPGVRLDSRDVFLQALQTYAGSSADFVDCFLAVRARDQNTSVVTFDEADFKKLGVLWEKP